MKAFQVERRDVMVNISLAIAGLILKHVTRNLKISFVSAVTSICTFLIK